MLAVQPSAAPRVLALASSTPWQTVIDAFLAGAVDSDNTRRAYRRQPALLLRNSSKADVVVFPARAAADPLLAVVGLVVLLRLIRRRPASFSENK